MDTTADTTPRWLSTFARHFRIGDKVVLILNIAFFAFCLANWLGWLPFERGFQPLQMVYLSGAMALQPAAWLIKPRSTLAAVVLLAASIALLVMAVTVRDGRDVALPKASVPAHQPNRSVRDRRNSVDRTAVTSVLREDATIAWELAEGTGQT